MAQPQRKLPGDRTIAFAAAIVSSKPPDLTVREYISLLTRHVAKGRRENALSTAYRHLDRSAYWRAECERIKEDSRIAQEERLEALREIDSLKTKLEAAKNAGVKRKRAEADVIPYSREIKKGRKDKEEKREVFLGGLVIEEVDVDDADLGGQSLMRKLYQIGLCFKPGVPMEPKAMAYHLCSAASEVAKVTTEALHQQCEAAINGTDLSTSMTAAGRVVAAVLAGQQKLLRINGGDSVQNQVTHALVGMYDKLLHTFETVSLQAAIAESITDSAHDLSSSPAKQKPKQKGGPPRVNIKDTPALNALTGLLSGIIKQLDSKQDAHKDIFEGFFYCVLARLGSRIYVVNFSHSRAANISEELDSLAPVGGDHNSSSPHVSKKSIPVRQAHLEAPYLLHLLKQALALATYFLTPPASSTSKSAKSKSVPKPGSITKNSLTLAAKERLQATLVHAIFGPGELDEESDLFLNRLQMPKAGGSTLTVPRVKEAEVGAWFQGEVWRLLGWEVLGREMAHT